MDPSLSTMDADLSNLNPSFSVLSVEILLTRKELGNSFSYIQASSFSFWRNRLITRTLSASRNCDRLLMSAGLNSELLRPAISFLTEFRHSKKELRYSSSSEWIFCLSLNEVYMKLSLLSKLRLSLYRVLFADSEPNDFILFEVTSSSVFFPSAQAFSCSTYLPFFSS